MFVVVVFWSGGVSGLSGRGISSRTFVLGALIGYVYVNSGSLRSAMLLHFFYNSTLVLLTFFIQHGGLDASWEEVGAEGLMLVVMSVLVLALLLLRRIPKIGT